MTSDGYNQVAQAFMPVLILRTYTGKCLVGTHCATVLCDRV